MKAYEYQVYDAFKREFHQMIMNGALKQAFAIGYGTPLPKVAAPDYEMTPKFASGEVTFKYDALNGMIDKCPAVLKRLGEQAKRCREAQPPHIMVPGDNTHELLFIMDGVIVFAHIEPLLLKLTLRWEANFIFGKGN